MPFIHGSGSADKGAIDARIKFLLQTLGDRKKDASLRIASLQILLDLSAFHSGPQSGPSRVLPIDNDWLSSSVNQILATTKSIFNNPADDANLRALSVRFLDLNIANNVADLRRVYGQTRSPELQFAIEQAFLEVSNELYFSLHPSSGPVASIIQLAPERGCVQPPKNRIVFLTRFYSTKAFNDRGSVVTAAQIVLKNKSGQRFEIKNAQSIGGWWGSLNGVLIFTLDQLSDFPAGIYTLGMEYAHQFNHIPNAGEVDDIPSVGHTVTVTIIDSSGGKRLSIGGEHGIGNVGE